MLEYSTLSPAQADGLACVSCGRSFMERGAPAHVPVGFSPTGSQVFVCIEHSGNPESA